MLNYINSNLQFFSIGWWHAGCGTVNLNGVNSNSQLNPHGGTVNPYNGIVWYPFYASTKDRGSELEADGGSWATFKATEMRIFTGVEPDQSTILISEFSGELKLYVCSSENCIFIQKIFNYSRFES